MCDLEPTEDQLSCAENKSCDALLAEINSGQPVCGIGESSGGMGGSSGGGGGGGCPELMCDCNGTPVTGQVMQNGQCVESCDDACAIIEQLGG